jgi:biotin carboxyl carrier protein
MKWQAQVNGVERTLETERDASGTFRVDLDGASLDVDAVETVPGSWSLLIGGKAFEARVQAEGDKIGVQCGGEEFRVALHDPRAWRRSHGGALEAEGRQQVTAPMPGKVVRVLVAAGETVELGQGLVVVEAMKMQNEIRAPKSGVVERLTVREGQAVSSGEAIAVIA